MKTILICFTLLVGICLVGLDKQRTVKECVAAGADPLTCESSYAWGLI